MQRELGVPDNLHQERIARHPVVVLPELFAGPADALPGIPTMISTRLQLELLLQEVPIDLRAVSSVILADAGATLQILRLIGEEYPDQEDRPTRIQDCIVSLRKEDWYRTVCSAGILHNGPLTIEWQRCRNIADCARELARKAGGICPDEAYVAGLLYRLGSFAHLLGWNAQSSVGEDQALGIMLADYWHLPSYLLDAIKDQQAPVASSVWKSLLSSAQHLADNADGSSSIESDG